MNGRLALTPVRVNAWPPLDRGLWIAAKQPADLFEDDIGIASSWSAPTILSVERGYGIYLAWLGAVIGIDSTVMPFGRVDHDLIKRFLADYAYGRAPSTTASAIRGVAYVVRATHPGGLPWLTRLAHRLANAAQPVRPKLPRMVPIQELIELGMDLIRRGETAWQEGRRSGGQGYRDGLMIASLATRPLRRRNLSALRLGHSLLRDGNGYRVSFKKGKSTKTGQAIEFHYPAWLTPWFDFYVEHIRPSLLSRSNMVDEGWAWIGRRGQPLQADQISTGISKITLRHLGRPVSPHLFRDCAATDIALFDAAHIGITKEVLGHAQLSTSQKYYNQATSFTAVRRLDEVLARLMKG